MRKATTSYFAVLTSVAIGLGSAIAPSTAAASPVAYPKGSYARVARERTVVIWDAAKKREHFIRHVTFDGDAKEIALLLPTPTEPSFGGVSDRLIDHVARDANDGVGVHGAAGDLDDAGIVDSGAVKILESTPLRGGDADALGDWLTKHAYADRPSLRAWAQTYFAKRWVINAIRFAVPQPAEAPDGGDRPRIEAPAFRASFDIDAPFYPYTEPSDDVNDEREFIARTGKLGMPTRPLYAWVVAGGPVEAFQHDELSGPYLHASAPISGERLLRSTGDTSGWGFDPRAQREWTVTYLNQFEERAAREDVRFAPARVLAQAPPPKPPQALPQGGHGKRWKILSALALAALVAGVLILELGRTKDRNA